MNARLAACLLCAVTTHVAVADPDGARGRAREAPPARGQVLVGARATWRWQVVTAPRSVPQIGALAVSGLDVAAGRAAAPVAVLGEPAPAPRGWPFAVDAAGAAAAIP
ncbi:MAG TPA: hypothetical protein VK932_02060, partial [Kofleriaceae bacterium]|nr:hypothetical protein [Kofleriaceae bacterium]